MVINTREVSGVTFLDCIKQGPFSSEGAGLIALVQKMLAAGKKKIVVNLNPGDCRIPLPILSTCHYLVKSSGGRLVLLNSFSLPSTYTTEEDAIASFEDMPADQMKGVSES